MRRSHWLLGGVALVMAVGIAAYTTRAAGLFPGFPVIAAGPFCGGVVSPTAVASPGQGVTGVPAGQPAFATLPQAVQGVGTGTGLVQAALITSCSSAVPAGPTTYTGLEMLVADVENQQGQAPETIGVPLMGLGGGTPVVQTANTSIVATNGQGAYLFNQAALMTIASITLPPTPVNGQVFKLVNAGVGVITTSSIVVGTTGQTISGTAVTGIPVQTAASGGAGTVGWMYVLAPGALANTGVWYRIS